MDDTEKKLLLECAKFYGFSYPKIVKIEKWEDGGKFSISKLVNKCLTDSDIIITRAKTSPFSGGKDLGEWWIGYPTSSTLFRLKDDDFKTFLRDKKINQIIKK